MMWLEMIKIEAAIGQEGTVANALKALNQDILKNPYCSGLTEIIVYNHASVRGYFAICLVWKTEYPQTAGSSVGLNVSQTLKALGLLDHSVWIEKERRGEWV